MSLTGFLSKQDSGFVRAVNSIRNMSRMSYSVAEWASLISAHCSRAHETDLLNFHVSYLGVGPFRGLIGEVFFKGEYLFEAESDSPVILDCGANIGLATLFFKHLYPKARISCFEADPTTAAILQKNINQNHLANVAVHNLMLSNEEGEHSFYIDDVAGSLTMSSILGRNPNGHEIKVKCGRLSRFIESPIDLLKLDVEGAEYDVMIDLKTSGKISHIRKMVIEYHHKAGSQPSCLAKFLALLEEEGFEYQISAEHYPIAQQDTYQDILIGAYRPACTKTLSC